MKFDINEIRFGLAQKYGLPESEIDESVISLYILIDRMNQDTTKLTLYQKQEISKALEEIKAIQQSKLKPISYDDPKSAFWGNFGSRGITAIAFSLAIIVSALVFRSWHSDQQLIKNLQYLKAHIKVTPEGYFIPSTSYDQVKGGILIKP